jgi:O-antigen biosynthesis protein
MQLSIIIVNYNVKYFLEHCLISVLAACKNISSEIWVVDNASTDDSVSMVQQKFLSVKLIANTKNVGFAKANNQALAQATGQYILYLNPDTILPEDSLIKCLNYLQKNPKVGALGAKLIDGKGVFLPESKRGFPSPSAAFFKISGLSSIFSKSKFFNKYHAGYLSTHTTNEVDVLVGCFMIMPAALAKKLGGFSEDYFMYGEDIDLSYMVQKAGYTNVYFADTTVIHYKGESTKKGSLNYVKLFYKAMIIFAQKHLHGRGKGVFIFLIQCAIFLRATLSVVNSFFKQIMWFLADAGVMLFSLLYTKHLWISYVKPGTYYPPAMLNIFLLAYIFIWLCSLYLSGAYDVPVKKQSIWKGIGIGTLLTLSIYGLLPEQYRFSRGITLVGACLSGAIIWSIRALLQRIGTIPTVNSGNNILTVCNNDAGILHLLQKAGIQKDVVGNIGIHEVQDNNLGTLQDINTIAKYYKANEIIFGFPDVSFKKIIQLIEQLGPSYNYKIHANGTTSIIGSNSKHTAGDLYAANWHFAIATPFGRRNKRVFDILACMALFISLPINFIWLDNKKFLPHIIKVLFGSHTWIGYVNQQDALPNLKPSIFSVPIKGSSINTAAINLNYARNYTTSMDIANLWKILKRG